MTEHWEKYEIGENKPLDKKLIKELGDFHFLGNIFNLEINKNLLKNEIENNNIRINGIEMASSSKKCKKCGFNSIQSMPFQYRSADEGMGIKHRCMQCGNIEIEY